MSKARRSPRLWRFRTICRLRGARFDFVVPLAMLATAIATAWMFVGADAARAHGRSVSYSSFEIDERGADVSLRLTLLELSRLGPEALPPETLGVPAGPEPEPLRDVAAERFARTLTLARGAVPCPVSGRVRRFAEREGFVRYDWRVDCPARTGPLEIRSRVLLDVAPSHLHFARVRFRGDPATVRERVLTEASPSFSIRAGDSGDERGADRAAGIEGSRFRDYLELGVRHILSGWDHLAFLFGLMLLSDRAAAIARLVTGFTLAHSLTLALTVLGVIHPRAAAVETVIAFSVALVAIEKGWLVAGHGRAIPGAVLAGLAGLLAAAALNASTLPWQSALGLMLFTACYFALAARHTSDWTRVALTFAFGLVHGFGFAGILGELDLPSDRLVPALAGFNLGVELGQLAVVALAWPALLVAGGLVPPGGKRWARDLAVAGLCGLGCFWLAERGLAF